MIKKICLPILIFLFTALTFGQEEQTNTPHHLGLNLGSTTGIGFSYRYWPNKIGFQVTGIPIISPGGRSFSSIGLSLLYLLQENKKIDLFGYLGNHFIITTSNNYLYNPNTGVGMTKKVTNANYNVGVGLGLRLRLHQKLNLNLQSGYGVYQIGNKSILGTIAGEIGLYYQF